MANQTYLTPVSWRPRPMDTSTQPELRVPTPTSLTPPDRSEGGLYLEEARRAFMRGQEAMMGEARPETEAPRADAATQNFVLNFLLREQEQQIKGLKEKLAQQTGYVEDDSMEGSEKSQGLGSAYLLADKRNALQKAATARPFLQPPIQTTEYKQEGSEQDTEAQGKASQDFAAQLNAMPFTNPESQQPASIATSTQPRFSRLPVTPASTVLPRYQGVRSSRVRKVRKPVQSVANRAIKRDLRGFVNWKGERVVPPKEAGHVVI